MKVLCVLLVMQILLAVSCHDSAENKANLDIASQAPTKADADFRKLPADSAKYGAVLDAKDWQNPYLVVRRGDVELIVRATSLSDRRPVPLDEVAKALRELPPSAWPYGNVVAVQENSIVSGNDKELILHNRVEVEKILKSLGTTIVFWPSS